MNIRNIVTQAVIGYKRAREYELRIYSVIGLLTVEAGNTAYVDEMGSIQTASEKIIGEVLGWDIYGDEEDDFAKIQEMLDDDKKEIKDIVDYIMSKMNKGE